MQDPVDTLTNKTLHKRYQAKKKNAINLVQTLLTENNQIMNAQQWQSTFKNEKKKDDLSDSLLMALAWSRWRRNAIALV